MLEVDEKTIIEKNHKCRSLLLKDDLHRVELSPMVRKDKRLDTILLEVANHHVKTKNDKSTLIELQDSGTMILNDGISDCIFWEIHYYDKYWNCVVDPLYYPEPRRLLYICNLKESHEIHL